MSLISNDYLTTEELAEMKGVSLRTVYSWVKRGVAPSFKQWRKQYWFEKTAALDFKLPDRGRPRKTPQGVKGAGFPREEG